MPRNFEQIEIININSRIFGENGNEYYDHFKAETPLRNIAEFEKRMILDEEMGRNEMYFTILEGEEYPREIKYDREQKKLFMSEMLTPEVLESERLQEPAPVPKLSAWSSIKNFFNNLFFGSDTEEVQRHNEATQQYANDLAKYNESRKLLSGAGKTMEKAKADRDLVYEKIDVNKIINESQATSLREYASNKLEQLKIQLKRTDKIIDDGSPEARQQRDALLFNFTILSEIEKNADNIAPGDINTFIKNTVKHNGAFIRNISGKTKNELVENLQNEYVTEEAVKGKIYLLKNNPKSISEEISNVFEEMQEELSDKNNQEIYDGKMTAKLVTLKIMNDNIEGFDEIDVKSESVIDFFSKLDLYTNANEKFIDKLCPKNNDKMELQAEFERDSIIDEQKGYVNGELQTGFEKFNNFKSGLKTIKEERNKSGKEKGFEIVEDVDDAIYENSKKSKEQKKQIDEEREENISFI